MVEIISEFQVVLPVLTDDRALFPLTEGMPKCLLPIANRPFLQYQLDSLEKCGITGSKSFYNLNQFLFNLFALLLVGFICRSFHCISCGV